jgi:hypothetical protein
MIRIFTQIRKTLLKQYKFQRYFLYAIGEIFLVVIGILIALQVNNWNEERIEHKKLNEFLLSFTTDLDRDEKLIQNSIDSLEKDLNDLESYLNTMSSPNINKDSLVSISSKKYNPVIHGGISFNDNTIESPLAADMLGLLEPLFRRKIVALNEMKRNYETQVISDINVYVIQSSTFGQKYPFHAPGHLGPETNLSKQIWEQTNIVELGAAMNGLYGFKYAIESRSLKDLSEILSLTRDLLIRMEKL